MKLLIRTMTAIVSVVVALLSLSASAMDDGRVIADIALAAKQQNVAPPQPWLSALRITDNDNTAIDLADGAQLMQRPKLAASYNNEAHNVSRFYQTNSPRVNMIWHYAGRKAGEIFSLGMDSGYRAEKITIRPALFVGYARSLSIGSGKYFTFAAGGWFGGRVTHKACRDERDRKYYCGSLIAWSDFHPQQKNLQTYYQLVYRHEF